VSQVAEINVEYSGREIMDQLRQLEIEIKELTAEVRGLRNDVKVANEADVRSREALQLSQSNEKRIDRLESSRLNMLFGLLVAVGTSLLSLITSLLK